MTSLRHYTEQGHPAVELRTARARLAVVPSLGGRIVGLSRLEGGGREWCWHRDGLRWLWPSKAYDNFGDGPQAGVDECLPSVAACEVRGRRIPDHGELWYRAWELDDGALRRGVIASTVRLGVSPFVFRREIAAAADDVFELSYTLESLSDEPEPWLWCLHPLLRIERDDRLELPAGSLRLNGGVGAPMRHGEVWPYPEPRPGVRLDRLETPGMPGACVKAFAGPLDEGRAAIANDRTGERLEFRWDARVLPFLGLWLNRGFLGFEHVALEPTNGAPDSLADALDSWKSCAVLAPRAKAAWSVELRLS